MCLFVSHGNVKSSTRAVSRCVPRKLVVYDGLSAVLLASQWYGGLSGVLLASRSYGGLSGVFLKSRWYGGLSGVFLKSRWYGGLSADVSLVRR